MGPWRLQREDISEQVVGEVNLGQYSPRWESQNGLGSSVIKEMRWSVNREKVIAKFEDMTSEILNKRNVIRGRG